VLFRYSWQKWRGPPTSGGEPGPTIHNKVKLHSYLHSFQKFFSWQTKYSIYDWNNSIKDLIGLYLNIHTSLLCLTTSPLAISSSEIISQQMLYIQLKFQKYRSGVGNLFTITVRIFCALSLAGRKVN